MSVVLIMIVRASFSLCLDFNVLCDVGMLIIMNERSFSSLGPRLEA